MLLSNKDNVRDSSMNRVCAETQTNPPKMYTETDEFGFVLLMTSTTVAFILIALLLKYFRRVNSNPYGEDISEASNAEV